MARHFVEQKCQSRAGGFRAGYDVSLGFASNTGVSHSVLGQSVLAVQGVELGEESWLSVVRISGNGNPMTANRLRSVVVDACFDVDNFFKDRNWEDAAEEANDGDVAENVSDFGTCAKRKNDQV